ncbi:MAG: phytanoyl-CoA dioxygenase family protein [Caldilineaceae bacterium SB0675_bin_29]|uniref:Phytanoyl-CoA dioxygenase family protein n=1 Tax=Caldilineaceae bacterium SB0675_bin_29 TaxID=2605266 RepID=A0A6B1FZ27_9CHLR|nr:phytanoyl-CoA dioxygenase family protein [Caldilineaceae bacterium SB0675_bin_29]
MPDQQLGDNTPYVFAHSLGQQLDLSAQEYPTVNADGLPVVDLTPEQKYCFDKNGWLLVPGVLSAEEAREMRDFGLQLQHDPESIPEHERSPLGGPLTKLSDHPVVVGFMNEFVAFPPLSRRNCYGFRMESCSLFYREAGEGKFGPHNGSGFFRFPGDTHFYHSVPGKSHAGLTRVVWELNPVREGDGTLVVTGSHKSAYPAPDSIHEQHSPIWDDYTCPAGSVLFFTESLTHSARPWTNRETPRVAIFSCYNTPDSKWHDWDPNPDLVATMPPLRRTLFRPVRAANNLSDGSHYSV